MSWCLPVVDYYHKPLFLSATNIPPEQRIHCKEPLRVSCATAGVRPPTDGAVKTLRKMNEKPLEGCTIGERFAPGAAQSHAMTFWPYSPLGVKVGAELREQDDVTYQRREAEMTKPYDCVGLNTHD